MWLPPMILMLVLIAGMIVPWIVYFRLRNLSPEVAEDAQRRLLHEYTGGSILLSALVIGWTFVARLGGGDTGCPEWAMPNLELFVIAMIGGLVGASAAWKQHQYVLSDLYLMLPTVVLIPHFYYVNISWG